MPAEPRERPGDAGHRAAAGDGRGQGGADDVRDAQHLAPRGRVLGRRRRPVYGAPRPQRALSNRREGDGTTPAGTFRIGRTMYGNEANPGVRFQYRRLRCGDWWDQDPSSPTYNTFQHVPCGNEAALRWWERRDVAAAPALPVPGGDRVQHAPRRAGPRLGIFLHAQTGGPTIGCVSLRKEQLRAVLRWLRPADAPVIAIGTSAQLRGLNARAAAGTLVFLVLVPGTVAGLIPWLLTGWDVRAVALATGPRRWRPAACHRRGSPPPRLPPVRRRRRRHAGSGRTHEAPRRRRPLPLRSQPDVPRGRGDDPWVRRSHWASSCCCVRRGVFAVTVYTFVRTYEEPTLGRQFGEQYEEYRRAVPGWWPRRTPWSAS